MIAFAKAMTDEEIEAAARYFASIERTPWIGVVETAMVPRTRIAGGMFLVLEGAEAGTEPTGQRIIETPEGYVGGGERGPGQVGAILLTLFPVPLTRTAARRSDPAVRPSEPGRTRRTRQSRRRTQTPSRRNRARRR